MALGQYIPRYTSRDLPIMAATVLPMSVVINYIVFGLPYLKELRIFLPATLVGAIFFGLGYFIFLNIIISLRNRFPGESAHALRTSISIFLNLLVAAVYLSILLRGYDYVHFLGYHFMEDDFTKGFGVYLATLVFQIFLNEGVYRFESYRTTIRETEQLKKEYMQSQLLGLKSQLNPHFLFNSLNTLSSLIHENAEQAEEFLDHMSKVYRYLLRNNEEQLVPLETELNFIRSYYYLLKARHADGLDISISAEEKAKEFLIPPLTLQMILENAMNQNSLTKSQPLRIRITATGCCLVVENNVQPKLNKTEGTDISLENISKKLKLLGQKELMIAFGTGGGRTITLPLLTQNEMAVYD